MRPSLPIGLCSCYMSKWNALLLKYQVLYFLQNLVLVNILNKAFKLLAIWISNSQIINYDRFAEMKEI